MVFIIFALYRCFYCTEYGVALLTLFQLDPTWICLPFSIIILVSYYFLCGLNGSLKCSWWLFIRLSQPLILIVHSLHFHVDSTWSWILLNTISCSVHNQIIILHLSLIDLWNLVGGSYSDRLDLKIKSLSQFIFRSIQLQHVYFCTLILVYSFGFA